MTCRYRGPFGCNGGTACGSTAGDLQNSVMIVIVGTEATDVIASRVTPVLNYDVGPKLETVRWVKHPNNVPPMREHRVIDREVQVLASRRSPRYRLPPPKFSFYQGDLM